MLKRFVASAITVAALLTVPSPGRAQTAQPAPAPRHDISGIWDPANGRGDGIMGTGAKAMRSEEHTSELQSLAYLVCRLLLEKKKKKESYKVRVVEGSQKYDTPVS